MRKFIKKTVLCAAGTVPEVTWSNTVRFFGRLEDCDKTFFTHLLASGGSDCELVFAHMGDISMISNIKTTENCLRKRSQITGLNVFIDVIDTMSFRMTRKWVQFTIFIFPRNVETKKKRR